MKNYRDKFRNYLQDLSKKMPHPGGGSVASLNFCLGVSLLQMALNFSSPDLKEVVKKLEKVKNEIFPFIDLDGEIFTKLINEKAPAKKKKLLKEAQQLSFDIGKKCNKILTIAKKVHSKVKKSIESDFYIGLKLLETALFASLKNLEVNQRIFKVSNRRKVSLLKRYLEEFKLWLK
jgi:formiminotetrahydrofolate cyclodeaminase